MGRLRILALSDAHGKEDIVQSFLEWVKKDSINYDIIVAAGDIGNPQRPGSMCRILRALAEGLGKNVYYVKGNWDVEDGCDGHRIHDLDRTGPVVFGDILLVGHGRRADPYDLSPLARSVVLVTHYPPFSILDKGKLIDSYKHSLHAGIPEINYLVDSYKPLVHIFGHSHSFGGLDVELNGVKYVNVARLDRLAKNGEPMGNYAIVDVSGAGVRVEWRFINGVWKKCAGCGKIVHIPEKWSMCRKCANKSEVKVTKLQGLRGKYLLKITDAGSGGLLFQKNLYIPVETIGDKTAFEDFLDLVILRSAKNLLQADGARVIEMPKDKVLEYYRTGRSSPLVPFSEYLFACNSAEGGERLCALMKVFSLDKRAHVLWKVLENNNERVAEYVLFSEDALRSAPDLPRILMNTGFVPLTYSLGAF